jgi:hypothetical protein
MGIMIYAGTSLFQVITPTPGIYPNTGILQYPQCLLVDAAAFIGRKHLHLGLH